MSLRRLCRFREGVDGYDMPAPPILAWFRVPCGMKTTDSALTLDRLMGRWKCLAVPNFVATEQSVGDPYE
jgi:hypothetical protein